MVLWDRVLCGAAVVAEASSGQTVTVQHLITSFGFLAVFLLMVAESACIPVPSEVVMPFAGAMAATGRLSLVGVIIAGVIGNVVGSYIAWAVGWVGGHPAIRKFGRYVWLKEEDLDRAHRWFTRRGEAAVFVGRLLPVIRTFISLPAGAAQMPPARFGAYSAAGSVPWVAALAVAGYEIGSRWQEIAAVMSKATDVVALIVAAALAIGIWTLYKRSSRARV